MTIAEVAANEDLYFGGTDNSMLLAVIPCWVPWM
jgi:hypothetical protein